MFLYLGEDSNSYVEKINNAIDKDGLNLFRIKNEKGSFDAFEALSDGNVGYAYYNQKGSFYEFVDKESCIETNFISKIPVAKRSLVKPTSVANLLLSKRNEDKKIEIHNIEILDENYNIRKLEGILSRSGDKEGFLLKTKILSSFNKESDKIKHHFIEKDKIIKSEIKESILYMTNDEINERNQNEKRLNLFKKVEDLKNLGINITDENHNEFLVKRLTKYAELLDLKAGDLSLEGSGLEIRDEMRDLLHEKNLLEIKGKMVNEGIWIDINQNDEKDSLMFNVVNSENKVLSTLEYPKHYCYGENIDDSYEFLLLEFDEQNIKIYENEKVLDLKDSKFKNLYEIFDQKVYLNDIKEPEIVSLHNRVDEIVIYGIGYELSKLKIDDMVHVNNKLLEKIKEKPEDFEGIIEKPKNKRKVRNSMK